MNKVSEPLSPSTIYVTEDLEEIKQHGVIDFPLAIYPVEFQETTKTHIRWHWHTEIELIYVNEGQITFLVAEDSYTLHQGQGLFINSNTLHSASPCGNQKSMYHSIVFHPALLFGYEQSSLAAKYLDPLIHSNLHYLTFDGSSAYHQPILDVMEVLMRLNLGKDFCYELECKVHLTKLWILLLRQLKNIEYIVGVRSPQQSLDELRAKEALSFIESHYAEPLTLNDIADSIHISNSECCRCFKRCINLTPFEYLMKYRIYIATSQMLHDEITSIADIASAVGFNSSSYFNKLFRKYMGCTPTQFRKAPLNYDFVEDHFFIPFS